MEQTDFIEEEKEMYHYFISYFYNYKYFGNSEVYIEKKIENIKDIHSIANIIDNDKNYDNVVIMNYRLFGE